jgi:hypothetical protein
MENQYENQVLKREQSHGVKTQQTLVENKKAAVSSGRY